MARLLLEEVSREYAGGQLAVDHLSLEVCDRELLVLVGPSGSGKTTTLRIIAGFESPSAGKIGLDGRSLDGVAPQERDVAMVFQGCVLYPRLSVYGNMAFGLSLRSRVGWLRRAAWRVFRPGRSEAWRRRQRALDARIRAAARWLGIEDLLPRMPSDLSGGERQRVALGRALVRRPAVFLFDEPLSSLDPPLRARLRRDLKRLHQQIQATMVYVTHDQEEALALGDRVAVLDRGRLQQVGRPQEVYQRPANRFVAGFIGSPPMNLLAGRLHREASDSVLTVCGRNVVVAGPRPLEPADEVWMGVRADDVRLLPAEEPGEAKAICGKVDLVETLGETTLVHVTLAGVAGGPGLCPSHGLNPAGSVRGPSELAIDAVIARLPGDASWRVGQWAQVSWNWDRVHWFGRADGLRLPVVELG